MPRSITYKRYTPELPRIKWFGPTVRLVDSAIVQRDMRTVQAFGYEVVTITIPRQFEIVHRYLRTFYPDLAKFVHDYSLERGGWGWFLSVGRTIELQCKAPANRMYSTEPCLVIPYKGRMQKRIALKFVISMLQSYVDIQEQSRKRK